MNHTFLSTLTTHKYIHLRVSLVMRLVQEWCPAARRLKFDLTF